MDSRTFTLIKPDAVAAGHTGKILDAILGAGFRIVALRMVFLSRNQAERFYAVHRDKAFFTRLVIFMTSGPVVAAVLEKENAVADFRTLIGVTDPAQAAEGTLRRRFAASMTRNAVHGSDSDENARIEWEHFFTADDLMEAQYCLPAEVEG